MSPEQCISGKIDARSDIYSLGCIMHECLLGKTPFQGESPLDVMYRHANESLSKLDLLKVLPLALAEIISNCYAISRIYLEQKLFNERLHAMEKCCAAYKKVKGAAYSRSARLRELAQCCVANDRYKDALEISQESLKVAILGGKSCRVQLASTALWQAGLQAEHAETLAANKSYELAADTFESLAPEFRTELKSCLEEWHSFCLSAHLSDDAKMVEQRLKGL